MSLFYKCHGTKHMNPAIWKGEITFWIVLNSLKLTSVPGEVHFMQLLVHTAITILSAFLIGV